MFSDWYDSIKEPYRFIFFMLVVIVPIIVLFNIGKFIILCIFIFIALLLFRMKGFIPWMKKLLKRERKIR